MEDIILALILSILIYLLLAIIIPIILRPHRIYLRRDIQKTRKIKRIAHSLKARNKEDTLKNIYNYVIKRYKGNEQKYKLLNYPKLFYFNTNEILKRRQFLSCHQQNLVLRTLLINTKQFDIKDFELKETMTNFGVIHQYIIVNLGKIKYKIDPFFKIFEKI
ncbi:MAG: hypothetical protein WC438_05410 [Candidatus Pacearchaeota archaeon]